MKRWKKIVAICICVILECGIGCGIYISDYYHAQEEAVKSMQMKEAEVKAIEIEGEQIIFAPDDPKAGLIFYPGGKVEAESYAPLLAALAREGILTVLVPMPAKLAVLDSDAAEGVVEHYDEIEEWYMAGHSLGGSMAAAYLKKNKEAYEGLILLGSYSTADFSESDLSVLSIYGSEDGVMNHEKYEKNKKNLPGDFTEFVIDGGCHAGFGMYGTQDGEGTPTISGAEQIDTTAEVIEKFLSR